MGTTTVVSYEEFEQAMQALGLIKVYIACSHEEEFHWRDHSDCYPRADCYPYEDETRWEMVT